MGYVYGVCAYYMGVWEGGFQHYLPNAEPNEYPDVVLSPHRDRELKSRRPSGYHWQQIMTSSVLTHRRNWDTVE